MNPSRDGNSVRNMVPFDMPRLISECAPYREQTQPHGDPQPRGHRSLGRTLPIHNCLPARDDGEDGKAHSKRLTHGSVYAKIYSAEWRLPDLPA